MVQGEQAVSEAVAVAIPLVNPNEPVARLAVLAVSEGQQVEAGQLLATLETTKAVQEVAAPQSGYVVGLQGGAGKDATAGETLCWIADTPTWAPPAASQAIVPSGPSSDGLRITKAAQALAEGEGIDLAALPKDEWVTEDTVRRLMAARRQANLPDESYGGSALVVYGGGGHGKALIELVRAAGQFTVVGVVDDRLNPGEMVLDVPVLGGHEVLPLLAARDLQWAINAVGSIGDASLRWAVFDRLRRSGLTCPTVVHPSAWLEPSARLYEGVQVMPHAYIGSDAEVGYGTIVNTAAVVSHDCLLGQCVNVAPGALLAGAVYIEDGALIGMGVTVHLGVRIGKGARCGNSAVITADVPVGAVVRAGSLWQG